MIRKLFLAVAFLLFSLLSVAQETGDRQREEFLYWESVLDAYEDFANAREQLRGSRRAAETLREKQLRIEGLLQHPIGKMTSQQQQRFNAISLRAGLHSRYPSRRKRKPLQNPPRSSRQYKRRPWPNRSPQPPPFPKRPKNPSRLP